MKTVRLALAFCAMIALPTASALAIMVDPLSARLAKLPDIEKRAAMRRAILDNEQVCKMVDRVALQERYKNLTMWTAHCVKGGDYGVFIGPDQSVQVRPCADLPKLKLPVCKLPKAK
jgi:hypothetical protein